MSEELPREVAGRILSLRDEGETWKAFAARNGLSPQVVSNWRHQGDGASLDAAAKVLEHHRPRLSPAWVLVGLPPRYLPKGVKMEDAVRQELKVYAVKLEVIGMVSDESVSADAAEKIKQSVQTIVLGRDEGVDELREDTEGASPFGDGRGGRRKAEPK